MRRPTPRAQILLGWYRTPAEIRRSKQRARQAMLLVCSTLALCESY